jgi:hypothetical protein
LSLAEYEGGRPTLSANVAASGPELGEQFVRVYDAAGLVTIDTSAEAGSVPGDAQVVQRALAGQISTLSLKADGESFRVRIVPIEKDGQITGALEVGRATGDVTDTLRTLLLVLAIAYPITLATASFGGVFLAGRALSPIDRLTRLARRISAEDLG